MARFRLIVFDWDGTLMDSAAHIVDSMRRAAADLGLPPRAEDEVRHIIGLGLREAVAALYPRADEAQRARLVERYRFHYLAADPTRPFPGAEAVLRALAGDGFLLGVATGKGRRGLDRALAHTGFGAYFHMTRCADEARSKPHPEMLEQIMDGLGVAPRHTLVVGDTEYDLEMAANAGAAAVAVDYGAHPRERLLARRPLACLGRLQELLPLVAAD